MSYIGKMFDASLVSTIRWINLYERLKNIFQQNSVCCNFVRGRRATVKLKTKELNTTSPDTLNVKVLSFY